MIRHAVLSLITLAHFCNAVPAPLSTAPASPPSTPGSLMILDTGVGHRSTPVPRWRTQLRQLSLSGTNGTSLAQFGDAPASENEVVEPINAYQLAYSHSTASLFLATGRGIISTSTDGSKPATIGQDTRDLHSIAVAEKSKKVYWGTIYDGFIRRADYNGQNVEVVRNVSQGINWALIQFAEYANSFADGIEVDEDDGWVYYSASRGDKDGSIRRFPLRSRWSGGGAADEDVRDEEVLVKGINMPGQLRILNGSLYWVEKGRWSNSPTAIKRAKIPRKAAGVTTTTSATKPWSTETVVSSDQSSLFFERDWTGAATTLSIQSFAFDEKKEKLWFVCQSSGRTMFGKLVEARLDGKGGLKVLNADTKDVGVPVGLEYVLNGKG